ncbi:MAG: serine/threonine protein kinase [Candidatus Aminicenantes bacterium]|nr:serine/threonine protein kinase [Candidatus Aminicenantes bacterium]
MEIKGKVGKYKILKKLGSGGFGTVYLAEDTFLKSQRALKIPHGLNSQKEKLLKESIVQTKLLDHPNIVKLLTVDIIDDNIVMVMEYVDGTDLEKIIDDSVKLSIKRALAYFRQILSALGYAHENKILHRDIRPSNILISKKNEVKITDFGTSTFLEESQHATTKIGSPPYMAPEQFEGKAVFASDIYSAGCLFYEMITGFPPIVLANPMEIYKRAKAGDFPSLIKKIPTLAPGINDIIMKTLSPDISGRYKTTGDILAAFDSLEKKKRGDPSEIFDIKKRIAARDERTDHICWSCRKTIPQKVEKCIYCGADQ